MGPKQLGPDVNSEFKPKLYSSRLHPINSNLALKLEALTYKRVCEAVFRHSCALFICLCLFSRISCFHSKSSDTVNAPSVLDFASSVLTCSLTLPHVGSLHCKLIHLCDVGINAKWITYTETLFVLLSDVTARAVRAERWRGDNSDKEGVIVSYQCCFYVIIHQKRKPKGAVDHRLYFFSSTFKMELNECIICVD